MEAQSDLDDYRPREEPARLTLTIEPSTKGHVWTYYVHTYWWVVCLVGIVIGGSANADRPDVAAALLLPSLFLFVALRILTHKPTRTVLRFLDEGLELAADGRGWLRVPWDLITRLVKDAAGGASLDTGEGGRMVARLPKAQLQELLAAAVLPAHVELIEVPSAQAPQSRRKTFVLWLVLVGLFIAIWALTER